MLKSVEVPESLVAPFQGAERHVEAPFSRFVRNPNEATHLPRRPPKAVASRRAVLHPRENGTAPQESRLRRERGSPQDFSERSNCGSEASTRVVA